MEKTLAGSEARAAATAKALTDAQTQLGEAGQVVRDAESTAQSAKGDVVAAQQKLLLVEAAAEERCVQKRLSGPAFYSGLHCFELVLGVFWGK
jgi:hypothetical protein